MTLIEKLSDNEINTLYIKRDDLLPYSFGGNKARKAINFFREIDAGDYDCVVTYGSSSSNHCRIIANMAAGRKLPCCIIEPQEASEPTFNSKLIDKLGAEKTIVPVSKVHDTIEAKLSELRTRGFHPYFIQGGGHGNPGTQAYVDCYDEICHWEQECHIHFDYIFHASGTGTTQAGLICGELIHGDKHRTVGISIARKNPRGRQIVTDSVNEYLKAYGIIVEKGRVEAAVLFIDDYICGGYGKGNPEISETIRDMMINNGIPMDPVYTGKAYTGMKKYLTENQITGKNILFIHTGGTPLFFDYLNAN